MSRFGASKFRNATTAIPGREEWYRSTLPAGGSIPNLQTSTFSSELKANHLHIVTLTTGGAVAWRRYADGGLELGGAKTGKAGGGTVGDWDLAQVGPSRIAVGCADGSISLYDLATDKLVLASQTPSTGKAITSISCHSTTSSVVLAATASVIQVWDLSTPSPATPTISIPLPEPKGIWSASWCPVGKHIAVIGKSGTLYVLDARSSSPESPLASRSIPIQPLKPAKVSWVGEDVFVTSTSRTRNREYHVFSPSKGLSTVFTATLDTSTAPLLSATDQERGIVYVASKGDMTVRQVEMGGATGYQETLHPLQQAVSAQGLALASPTTLAVMQAQIATVLVPVTDKDGEAILPLGIKVPRRQLIDFHADLYPDVAGVVPEQSPAEWFAGSDKLPLPMSLDPTRRSTIDQQLEKCATLSSSPETEPSGTAKPSSSSTERSDAATEPQPDTSNEKDPAPAESTPLATSAPSAQPADEAASAVPVPVAVATSSTTTASAAPEAAHQEVKGGISQEQAESRSVAPAPTPATATPASPEAASSVQYPPKPAAAVTQAPEQGSTRDPGATSSPKTPYNPGYSRKFLAGKAPLNAAYDSLPPVSTLHPDSLLLGMSEHLLFFPVQGPGGRLGVHPISKKGRMVTGGEGYLSAGCEIACFAVNPFLQEGQKSRVAVAGEDGAVRVWEVGKEGVSGSGPEANCVIKASGIDKIVHIAFHPTASDLLVLLSNDSGSANLRFFDLSPSASTPGGQAVCISLPCKGAYSFAFNALGSKVAVSAKDGTILAFDPRHAALDAGRIVSGKAHDSPRSFQLAWIDDSNLASVGFDRGSQRKVNVYSLAGPEVKRVYSSLIDVSPSVLFPTYDPDTRILYVWGKGERVIAAYEVLDENSPDRLFKLPSFTTATGEAQLSVAFYPKAKVDVKKVEVMKALRLTGRLIEEVSFTIPRNKPDFFQDDIYVDTLNTTSPSLTAARWLKGEDAGERRVSLKPDGMKLLSEAPKTTTASKAKFVPAKDVMTEQEKKQKEMDALFAKAKMGDSSDEDDEPKRTGIDPPDDDW